MEQPAGGAEAGSSRVGSGQRPRNRSDDGRGACHAAPLRRSVSGRRAGHHEVSSADRLAHDAATRAIVDRDGSRKSGTAGCLETVGS
jgi:hypothetical protein